MADEKIADESKDSSSNAETHTPRQRQVRDKLREMYGDDTPETVRRFLTDLIRQDDSNPEDPSGLPN